MMWHLLTEVDFSFTVFSKDQPLVYPQKAPLDAEHFVRFLETYAPSVKPAPTDRMSVAIATMQEESKAASIELRQVQLQSFDYMNLARSTQRDLWSAHLQVTRRETENRKLLRKVNKYFWPLGPGLERNSSGPVRVALPPCLCFELHL